MATSTVTRSTRTRAAKTVAQPAEQLLTMEQAQKLAYAIVRSEMERMGLKEPREQAAAQPEAQPQRTPVQSRHAATQPSAEQIDRDIAAVHAQQQPVRAARTVTAQQIAQPRKAVRKWPELAGVGEVRTQSVSFWHNRENVSVELDAIYLAAKRNGKTVSAPYMANWEGARIVQALYVPSTGMLMAVTPEVAKQIQENAELLRPMTDRKREAAEQYAAAHANDKREDTLIADMMDDAQEGNDVPDFLSSEEATQWALNGKSDDDYYR